MLSPVPYAENPDIREHVEGFRPQWYISAMIYSGDVPFWSKTLDICMLTRKRKKEC